MDGDLKNDLLGIVRPRLRRHLGPVKTGDFIEISGHWLRIPPGPSHRYALTFGSKDKEESAAVVYRALGPGRRVPVAVTVAQTHNGQTVNPLEKMKSVQLSHVRAVELHVWDASVARSLSRLAVKQLCIKLTEHLLEPDQRSPMLPDVPCLRVHISNLNSHAFVTSLRSNSRLRLLSVFGSPLEDGVLDVRNLRRHSNLRHLELSKTTLKNVQDLSRSIILESLDLSMSDGFKSGKFLHRLSALRVCDLRKSKLTSLPELGALHLLVHLDLSSTAIVRLPLAKMKSLRHLDISYTKVVDLRPLASCPKLKSVVATEAHAKYLPRSRMPALKLLDMVMSHTARAEVARFRRLNPQGAVLHTWQDALAYRTKGADYLEIVKTRDFLGQSKSRNPALKVRGKAEITRIARQLQGRLIGIGFGCFSHLLRFFVDAH